MDAGVLLELHLHYEDGSVEVAGGTDSSWMALNADHIYNPTGKEGGYGAPQENIDAGAVQTGWTAKTLQSAEVRVACVYVCTSVSVSVG